MLETSFPEVGNLSKLKLPFILIEDALIDPCGRTKKFTYCSEPIIDVVNLNCFIQHQGREISFAECNKGKIVVLTSKNDIIDFNSYNFKMNLKIQAD